MSQGVSNAGSKLPLIATVGFAIVSAISVIAGLGWITGQLIFAQILPEYLPMAPFAILFSLSLCVSYSLYDWRPGFSWIRIGAGVGALFVAIMSSVIVMCFLTGTELDIEASVLSNFESLRGYPIVTISPIAAALLLLGALSLILLVSIPRRLVRSCVAMCGMFVGFIGFVMTVGYVYNAPLLYGSSIRPVAFPAALAFLFLGMGIWASAGPDCWPTHELTGDTVRARLSRAFLPTTSLILVLFIIFQALIVQDIVGAALMGSLALLGSLAAMTLIVWRMARGIGGDVDREIGERKKAEEALAETLEQLQMSESQLRTYSEHLEELVKERTRGLSESEKRFRELAELLPGIIYETDANGNLTFMNRTGLSLMGYNDDDIKKGLNQLHLFAPQERNALLEHLRRTLKAETLPPHEHTAMGKDSTTFPVIMHSAPIMQKGRSVGVKAIAIDITDRKRVEQELAISRRMSTIGETAAMIGHDLRNPLQGISTATYILKKKLEPSSDEETKKMLSTIEKGIERSESIIADLLDYSREMRLETTETDLKSLTAEALSLAKVPGKVRVLNLTDNNLRIMVDRQNITRVFLNIITNAIEAMPEGGTLTVTTRQSDSTVELMFSDTGAGMTAEVMKQIWEPLFTTKSRGIGLGLPACKRIVEAHRGTIFVESTPGKGSTFIVNLPKIVKAEA